MSAAPSPSSPSRGFPEQVWRARLLSDLDARGRADLERAGRMRQVARGEALYNRGEACDTVYLLLEGQIDLARESAPARAARVGELFGIEGWVHAAAKRGETARARTTATLLEAPVHVLRRALVRAGRDADADARIVRSALREAVASALGRAGTKLTPDALDSLVDGVHSRALAAGETLRTPTSTAGVWILEGALVDGDRTYARDALVAAPAITLRAEEPAWAACLSDAALTIVQMSLGERASHDGSALADPKRALGSRSLMVLDGDSCIRCGHCVASCASAHDDGLARFLRQGAPFELRDRATMASAVVLPGSCGHCETAVCMVECPTGALVRNDAGDVVVRNDLCTGCGRCVEVCPWGNVRLAEIAAKPVAVKCDRCEGRSGGPACVDGCPTGAILRIEPADIPAINKWTNGQRDRRGKVAAICASVAVICALLPLDIRASGCAALVAFVASWAHAVSKRRSRAVQTSFALHLVLGASAAAFFLRHLTLAFSVHASASALSSCALVAVASGAFGAFVSRIAPPRLSRLGDDGALPGTLRASIARDEERTFALLSGASESLKALWRIELSPYAASRMGMIATLVAGPTLEAEETRLLERARVASQGRVDAAAARALVSHAVRLRARSARLAWHGLLRGWLPLHVAASTVATALLIAHAALHVLYK